MGKKKGAVAREAPAPEPPGALPPLAILLLIAIAAAELTLPFRRVWFTEEAAFVHLRVLRLVAEGVIAAGLLCLVWPRARAWCAGHLEGFGRLEPRRREAWLWAAFASLWAGLFWLKFCQYRGFQLPLDTAATVNTLWNILHAGRFTCTVLGVSSNFAVHFVPLMALLAPFSAIAGGTLPLILVQSALAASMPLAAYLLTARKSGSALAGFVALALVAASPALADLNAASVLPGMYLSFFFLWAMVFAEEGRWAPAGLLLLLTALTIEQSCLVFFGLGLALILRLGVRERRSWLLGGSACAASALAFYLELRLRYSYPEASAFRSWEMFSHLGPTPAAALGAALSRPLAFAAQALWPPAKLASAGWMLLSAGLFPLLAPESLPAWLAAAAPNLLAKPDDAYHQMILQYSGYVVGPLWWAMALGLARAHARLKARGREAWLLVVAACGVTASFYMAPHVLQRKWNWALFFEGPAMAARIPPGAPVWAEEFMTPWLAARSHLKALPMAPDPGFARGLFKPDFVLLGRDYRPAPETGGPVLTFLAREGYVREAELSRLVLLRHPKAPLAPGGAPPALALPAAGPEGDALLRGLQDIRDWAAIADNLRQAAEGGERMAQYNMGVILHDGAGRPRDVPAGRAWWRRAAEQGVPEAQQALGGSLVGDADPTAWFEGTHWLREAAERGDASAQFQLAVCYLKGRGLPQDAGAGVFWLRQAASRGQTEAQAALKKLEPPRR